MECNRKCLLSQCIKLRRDSYQGINWSENWSLILLHHLKLPNLELSKMAQTWTYIDSTSFAINNVMDTEVSLLQENVEKISFGTCRNSQGKCYPDSSAAQYSPGTSLTQPSEQFNHKLMKFLSPILTPAQSLTEWWLCLKAMVVLLLGQLRASPAERLRLCFCPSKSTGDSTDTKDLQSLANLGSYLMSLHSVHPTLV